jgi:hypothetical protein
MFNFWVNWIQITDGYSLGMFSKSLRYESEFLEPFMWKLMLVEFWAMNEFLSLHFMPCLLTSLPETLVGYLYYCDCLYENESFSEADVWSIQQIPKMSVTPKVNNHWSKQYHLSERNQDLFEPLILSSRGLVQMNSQRHCLAPLLGHGIIFQLYFYISSSRFQVICPWLFWFLPKVKHIF